MRQGDLLFKKVEEFVEGKTHKQLTIAEGEFTGHKHVLIAEAGSKIVGDKTKFTITGKAKLVHPEHDTIEFNSGTYVVLTEQEFNYVDMTLEKVRD